MGIYFTGRYKRQVATVRKECKVRTQKSKRSKGEMKGPVLLDLRLILAVFR